MQSDSNVLNSLLEHIDAKRIDVNQIMDLHAQIKEQLPIIDNNPISIAKTWARCAELMRNTGKVDVVEICYFMAVLYDRDNFDYVDQLIITYAQNKKYRYAVDFLEKLFIISDDESSHKFWYRMTNILPSEIIMAFIHRNGNPNLDKLIFEFELDINNPMSWMTLGYTLKSIDEVILANQALDNAIALKYH